VSTLAEAAHPSALTGLAKVREVPILLFTILLVAVLSVTVDGFFALQNLENISRQIAVIGLISVGMTLAILTGGIDLSVGSILAFSISIGGMLGILGGWPIWLVYPVILGLGLGLGLINGFLVTHLPVHALIVTLGTMNIYRGATMILSGGKDITGIPAAYTAIGRGYWPLIVLLAVLLLFIGVTQATRFGRNLFAIGGAGQAAEYSGVPVTRYKILVYAISGVLSALAGIVFVGRSGFIQPGIGPGYELSAIAAAVIGGTSIFGGVGSVVGTFLGAVLLGVILAGMTMLAISPYWQGAIEGSLIILALSFDMLRRRVL
jgi:ribose/xylose/arabinose/galactoside ABC-type transport system permease subunit